MITPIDNATHIMLDIESLDLAPSAIICSLGCVTFSLNDTPGTIRESAHWKLNWSNQMGTRSISHSTLTWWLDKKRNDVRDEILGGSILLEDMLTRLTRYIHYYFTNPESQIHIWSQGKTDIDCLKHAAEHCHLPDPFGSIHYRNFRDSRELNYSFNLLYPDVKMPNTDSYNASKHTALGDALYQANLAQFQIRYMIDHRDLPKG